MLTRVAKDEQVRTAATRKQYRLILRLSLDNDTDSTVRNAVARKLQAAGIQNVRTGGWESEQMSLRKMAKCIGAVMDILANPSQVEGVDKHFLLDHTWLLIEQSNPEM